MKKQTVPARRTHKEAERNRKPWVATVVIVLAIGAPIAVYRHTDRVQAKIPAGASGTASDTAAAPETKAPTPGMKHEVTFAPTIPNNATPGVKAPAGMVWIPGGE